LDPINLAIDWLIFLKDKQECSSLEKHTEAQYCLLTVGWIEISSFMGGTYSPKPSVKSGYLNVIISVEGSFVLSRI